MNELEGRAKIKLSKPREGDFGISPLFNVLLNNKLIRSISENVYESFSQPCEVEYY